MKKTKEGLKQIRSIKSNMNRGRKQTINSILIKAVVEGTKTATIKLVDRKQHNISSYYFTTRQLTAITELHSLFQCHYGT